MNYREAMYYVEKFIPAAIDKLFEDYAETMLSLDQTEVVSSIVSRIRLNAENENINNKPLATDSVERAFIGLLDEGRLTVKPFGFSVLAQEEIRKLRSVHPNASQSQPVFQEADREPTPEEIYSDVINHWQTLPTSKLNSLKSKNAVWLRRFEEADRLGLIR